jgi:hypothetical protein
MQVTLPMHGMLTSTTAMTIGTIRQILIMFVVFALATMIKRDTMFSFKNIYRAYKECKKNKSNTLNLLNFEANLVENLYNLEQSLKNRTYQIGKSICFLAHSPKLREVFAADFKDRVVHHILVNEIEPFYEKRFIYDVYNNRKNKGIHSAIKRAKDFMLRQNGDGLDFLGYIVRPHYILVRKRVVNNFRYKKAKYLQRYEELKGDMSLEEINKFLSVQSSFVAHAKHADSFKLIKKIGEMNEEKYIKLITTSWSG